MVAAVSEQTKSEQAVSQQTKSEQTVIEQTESEQTKSEWSHERYCAAVESEIARFVELVRAADPATPVPSCPGWTVADLVKHHGMSHRRVEHVVRHRVREPVWSKDLEPGLPDDQADYPAWLAAGAGPLLATLRAADPDAPMWTNGADQHARYWARRILYEAVVHRADAELAVGRKPDIDAETAVDGIDEFLTNLPFFRWVAEAVAELPHDGRAVRLHATDHEGEWMVTLDPAGFSWQRRHGTATSHEAHRKGTQPAPCVTVEGSAGDLLLLTYGRLPPADDRFAVAGDGRFLAQWLEKSAL
jgi:uncharacterized protein (TIGR03083 family)